MTSPTTLKRALVFLALIGLLLAVLPSITAAAPPPQGTIAYRVMPGDTLFSIAQRYGTTVPAIMAANGLTSDYIYVGQLLNIPTGQVVMTGTPTLTPLPNTTPTPTPTRNPAFGCTYTVQMHDTYYSIAYRYGTNVVALMQANYAYSTYLRAGQTLAVPCITPVPAPWASYTIKPGDNLFRIAINNQTSVYALAIVNGIPCPSLIYAGQTIVIPYPGSRIYGTPTPTGTIVTGATLTPTPTATGTGSTACSGNCTVIIRNLAFEPQNFTIGVNTTLTWLNIDTVTHTVTSGPVGAPNGIFTSGNLATGAQYSFRFTNTGTFPYYDPNYGNQMTGTIVVQ